MRTINGKKYYVHFESDEYYLVSIKKDSPKFKLDK